MDEVTMSVRKESNFRMRYQHEPGFQNNFSISEVGSDVPEDAVDQYRTQTSETWPIDQPKTSKWYAILVFVCAIIILAAQYIPYFTYYFENDNVYTPDLRTRSHYGDMLFTLLIFLTSSAQCFGNAQPFLLIVLLINLITVDLPWQLTLVMTSSKDVSCLTGCGTPPDSELKAKLHLSLSSIRLVTDIALIGTTFVELKRANGRLFIHLRNALPTRTVVLFFLCGLNAFLNQVPTLVAVFLSEYFYAGCESDLSLQTELSRDPLTSYFFSIFLLLISGITSRVQSKVLALLAVISTCTIGLFGQLTACVDHAIMACRTEGKCQTGFHEFASVFYGFVMILSILLAWLLWDQYKTLSKRLQEEGLYR